MPEPIARFTASVAAPLLDRLDRVLAQRGIVSRSQAIGEMIRRYLLEHADEIGERVLAGVITVVYANERVRGRVHEIQRSYLGEVISSQHVFLAGEKSLEALLVQGPGSRLRSLVDELSGCRGVEAVSLAITAAALSGLQGANGRAAEPLGVIR